MSQEKNCPTFAPLDLFRGEENLLSAQAQRRWLLALMIVGLAAPPDPLSAAIPPVGRRGHALGEFDRPRLRELLLPLHYCQVAPTLVSVGAIDGRQTPGLQRICPAADSLPLRTGQPAAVPPRGRTIAQGASLVLAVGLFAVAYPMTRYAAEAKPYGCDLLVALAMLALAIEWLRRPDQTRWLWYLAALVGPAVGYSFPAIFMAGGVSLVIACVMVAGVGGSVPAALADGTDLQAGTRCLLLWAGSLGSSTMSSSSPALPRCWSSASPRSARRTSRRWKSPTGPTPSRRSGNR